MNWRTDRPEKIGKYIIIIPEVVRIFGSPLAEQFPYQVNIGLIREAKFNGENFELTDYGNPICFEVGQCIWTPEPLILCEDGGLTIFETSEEGENDRNTNHKEDS